MDFRTAIKVSAFPFKLNMCSKILSIGSCFADMIGERTKQYNLSILSNPFGNIYNPVSIYKVADGNSDLLENIIEHEGIWYSYDLHSRQRSLTKEQLSLDIVQQQQKTADFIKNADCIVLTFGTAWVYKLKSSGQIIANCQKMPYSLFEKTILTTEEITSGFQKFLRGIMESNPGVNIVLTVSPVRHIKDTLELNSVSKSILRIACFELTRRFSNVFYFPSYEIMIDDLRDYRFYKKDLIHSNETAEDYIWDLWTKTLFDSEVINFMKSWDEVLTAMQHKPFNPGAPQHQKFLESMIQKLYELDTITDTTIQKQFFKDQLVIR